MLLRTPTDAYGCPQCNSIPYSISTEDRDSLASKEAIFVNKYGAQSGGFCLDLDKVQTFLGHRIVVCANDGAGRLSKGNIFFRLEQPFPSCDICWNCRIRCVNLWPTWARFLCLSHDHLLSRSGCGDFQRVILAVPQNRLCAVLTLLSHHNFSQSMTYSYRMLDDAESEQGGPRVERIYRDCCPAGAEIRVPAMDAARAMPRHKIDGAHPALLADRLFL